MIFLWFAVGQLVVAAVVVLVLWKNLDNLLVDMAMKQFDLRIRDKSSPISSVAVTTEKALGAATREKIAKEVLKNWGEAVNPVFQIDKSIWGGIIIKVGSNVIDCSLRDRLHRARTQR